MTYLLAILAFVFGAIMMSFFGLVIDRLPRKESIINPPSHCTSCNHKLSWYDNIPIISFILLKGKCRYCQKRIGLFSFFYELIGAMVFAIIVLRFKVSFDTLFLLIIFLILLFIAGYDYFTYEVLDLSWISLLIVTIIYCIYLVLVKEASYLNLIIGGAIGLIFFGTIKFFSKLITKKDCLGGGDVIVMAISGLFLGWYGIVFAIFVGSLVGSIIEVIKLKITKEEKMIPFTPYLVLGIFFATIFTEMIMDFIIKLM